MFQEKNILDRAYDGNAQVFAENAAKEEEEEANGKR
jgi:hypothetical protein